MHVSRFSQISATAEIRKKSGRWEEGAIGEEPITGFEIV